MIFSLSLGFYSYFKAIWTSPGYPDENLVSFLFRWRKFTIHKLLMIWKEGPLNKINSRNLGEINNSLEILKSIKSFNKRREIKCLVENSYCHKCNNVKLSRVHHCKICKRCIERMDHHCPWVGNCIGKYNHKYFYLFLLYTTVFFIWIRLPSS